MHRTTNVTTWKAAICVNFELHIVCTTECT